MSKVKIGLALAGGSALGMAHIGVIKALEEHNINVDIIAGTSVGSLVGGLYAAGVSVKTLEEECSKIRLRHLYTPSLDVAGVSSGKNLEKTIERVLDGDKYIASLPKQFAAVTVDVVRGEEYIFDSGMLLEAIRASISIPGVFTPVKAKDKILVDGGVLNNLPEDVVKNMGADVVIGVDLLSDYKPYTTPKTVLHALVFSWIYSIKKIVDLKPQFADVRLNLPLKKYRMFGFGEKKAKELIEIGYNETIKNIKEIKKAIKNATK